LTNQDDKTNQQVGDDHSEDTRESTSSSDIIEDDLDHGQKVLDLGQVHWNKSLRTTIIRLPNKESFADTVIAHPPLSNYENLPVAFEPPLHKSEKSSLLPKLF
jgi:hypothetical protein